MFKLDDFVKQEELKQEDSINVYQEAKQETPKIDEGYQESAPARPIEAPRIDEEPKSKSLLDAELEEMLARQRAKIKVVGCGGGGDNTINRITEIGVKGAETIAINTDA